jgi:hypothetical protein
MNKRFGYAVKHIFVLFGLISAVIISVPVFAEDDKPAGNFTVSALSQYIWRGYENTRNSIVFQPSMTVAYYGFTANVWGNMDTKPYTQTDADDASTWTETDLTLAYNRTFGAFNAGAGYIYYGLGAADSGGIKPSDSQEIYFSVGINKLLNPTLTVYKEIDRYRQWYVLISVSHVFELNPAVALQLSAAAGYLKSEYADAALYHVGGGYGGYPKFDDNYQPTDDDFDNFHDGTFTAALSIKIAEHVTVTPTLSYVFALSDDARKEIKARGKKENPADNDSSFLYGGMSIAVSF